jgi:hypothetical protein
MQINFGSGATIFYPEQDRYANDNRFAYVIENTDYFIFGLYVDYNEYLIEKYEEEFKLTNRDEMYCSVGFAVWLTETATQTTHFVHNQSGIETVLRILEIGAVPDNNPDGDNTNPDTNNNNNVALTEKKISPLQITLAALGGLLILCAGAWAIKTILPKKQKWR